MRNRLNSVGWWIAFCAIVVAYATLVLSPSYWPSPSRREPVQQKQPDSNPANKQADPDTNSRDKPFFAVKIIPSEYAAAERAESAKERKKKSSNERWLTIWTGIIGLFTIVLASVAGVQAWFFWRQLGIMKTGLDGAKIAADASTTAAIAAKDSAQAATKQAKIADEAFLRTERPYIFIYNVSFFLIDEQSGEFYVTYTVANFGKIPAIIDGSWIGFVFSHRGEPAQPTLLNEDHSLLVAPILAPGEKREGLREYLPIGVASDGRGAIVDIRGINATRPIPVLSVGERDQMFFNGIIRYRGPFTGGHATGALWLYLRDDFVTRGGPEYNYNR